MRINIEVPWNIGDPFYAIDGFHRLIEKYELDSVKISGTNNDAICLCAYDEYGNLQEFDLDGVHHTFDDAKIVLFQTEQESLSKRLCELEANLEAQRR